MAASSLGRAATSKDVPRYKVLGFTRTSEFGPLGGPVITTMWRQPLAAAGRLPEERRYS